MDDPRNQLRHLQEVNEPGPLCRFIARILTVIIAAIDWYDPTAEMKSEEMVQRWMKDNAKASE